MASYIDDGRVRQDQLQQTRVAEVIGHFVDVSRSAGAIQQGLGEVAGAESGKALLGQIQEAFRICAPGIAGRLRLAFLSKICR